MTIFPKRYTLSNLATVLHNPRMLLGELDQLGVEVNSYLQTQYRSIDSCSVMAEDWDNLILLDACRYDSYEERTPFDGALEHRVSGGSESWEFMQRNFVGRTLHDTVYITANPHAYKLDDGIFHSILNLLDNHWDPELKTVLPEEMARAAHTAHEEFPNKRLIIHFMQPHFPFIGEIGRTIDDEGITYHMDNYKPEDNGLTIWGKIRYGLVDRETVERAYHENLSIVFNIVEELLPGLSGKQL